VHVLKGRFLLQDWMTSLNHQATNIHRIDHDQTQLMPWRDTLVLAVHIPSKCGATISSKHLALLDEIDVNNWVLGYDLTLIEKYGRRQQCKWCR
jgi:hypothetical protein